MQNIIFMLLLSLGYIQADTVGVVAEKRWVDAPMVTEDRYKVSEAGIGEEIVIPARKTPSLIKEVIPPQLEDKKIDLIKYQKLFLDFISPLGVFIKDYTALFSSFLLLLSGMFYLLFYRPLARKIANFYDEEIEIPQVLSPLQHAQTPVIKESAIISQRRYSTLYGLINESFLYEKERLMLDKSLSQETQNREVISLEWKFNQILHFSLPKLSTNSIKRFKEGVKELLEEKITRDIMIIALEDIMIEGNFTAKEKETLIGMMKPYQKKESSLPKAANREASVGENYTNYMVQ
jgi:hypothetical protein